VLEVESLADANAPLQWSPRIAKILSWLDSWRRPPDPLVSQGFLETQQWALNYNPPRNGDEYEFAMEYAKSRYEEMLSLSETLDKKLDDLARTSLTIGVIIATVAKVFGSDTRLGNSHLLTPAVISFAISVLVAVWSRGPTMFRTPLEIRDLLKGMDNFTGLTKYQFHALSAASYHVAVVGTYATIEWKARQLWRSTFFLIVGIVLLLIMLITSPP
jgi:hypothetical protein